MLLSSSEFEDGMAAAMEAAFQEEWAAAKSVPLSDHGQEDRSMLFSAIAQGVVKYLSEHASDIFKVTDVEVRQNSPALIKSTGSILQKDGIDNQVVCKGIGKITGILS